MRLFFISLAIALLALLPQIAELRDAELPSSIHLLAMLPSAGLGYMTVFFHELGHTVTFWSYGQPAVPMFNLNDGGGFSEPFMGRTWFLQGVVYVAAAGLAWLLFADGAWLYLCCLLGIVALHAFFAVGEDRYMTPVNYMGNGGAVLMGCFCIWRAALNKVVSETSRELERYVHMTFGLFAVGYEGIFLSWKLMTNSAARDVYDAGIGERHLANDFSVLADRYNTNLQHVAAFHMVFTLSCLAVTGVLVFIGWRAQQDELAEAAESPQTTRRLRR